MQSIDLFNALDGRVSKRQEIENIIEIAIKEKQLDVVNRLSQLLADFPEANKFELQLSNKAEFLPGAALNMPMRNCGALFTHGLELDCDIEEDPHGLGKPVSSEEIYDMITNQVLDLMKSKKRLFWRKPWKQYFKGIESINFISKKAYRGINSMLLNVIAPLVREAKNLETSPFWLTFKQIQSKKGTIKKGAKGHKVVYFTKLYRLTQENPKIDFGTYDVKKFKAFIEKNQHKITDKAKEFYIPILKYYNVYNAADIDGIDFPEFKQPEQPKGPDKIAIAEAIVEHFPNPPKFKLEDTGNRAFYMPLVDSITMPKLSFFDQAQEYYSTFFHELVHSTGHESRLKRDMTGNFGTKKYAYEELVAELGALFLCAESGVMYYTLNNSAAYLKGWQKKLENILKSDNKFFFRASSHAQAAADFILDRDQNDTPRYLKSSKLKMKAKAQKKPVAKRKKKTKSSKKNEQMVLSLGTVHFDLDPINLSPDPIPEVKEGYPSGMVMDVPTTQTAIKTGPKPIPQTPKPPVQTPINRSKPKNKFIQNIGEAKSAAQYIENFDLIGPFSEFLGPIEKKPVGSVVITLDAPPGAGKTRSVFQFLNMVANAGYHSTFVSLEEHPQSKLFQDKGDEYISPNNIPLIDVMGSLPHTYKEFLEIIDQYDVIAVDSWNKVYDKFKIDFDLDLRQALHGKIIITIFQRTTNGTMRGGAKAAFDGDIILEIKKADDFRESYIHARKNRYQSIPLNQIGYNFYHQKVIDPSGESEDELPTEISF